MVLTKEQYEEIKSSFGMWMYESFQSVLHVTHYNFEKFGIKSLSHEDKVAMAIAIFDKRVELELTGRISCNAGVAQS